MENKIYIAGKITGDPNYKEKFSKMESESRFFVRLFKALQVILSYCQNDLGDMTGNIPSRFVLVI